MQILTKLSKAAFYAVALLLASLWAIVAGALVVLLALTIVGIPAAIGLAMLAGAPLTLLFKSLGVIK